jgi:hypothetical protein
MDKLLCHRLSASIYMRHGIIGRSRTQGHALRVQPSGFNACFDISSDQNERDTHAEEFDPCCLPWLRGDCPGSMQFQLWWW